MTHETLNFFAEEDCLSKLSKLGDQLEKLNSVMDWGIFESSQKGVFVKETKGAGGRPPYDYVMMFKILILQRIYNISDDQTEFQINDRMSFMRFLGLALGETAAADAAIRKWLSWAVRSRLEPVKEYARMVKKHYAGILRFFESRLTSGMMEGINSRVQEIKRRAKGFRNIPNFISMIYLEAGRLSLPS